MLSNNNIKKQRSHNLKNINLKKSSVHLFRNKTKVIASRQSTNDSNEIRNFKQSNDLFWHHMHIAPFDCHLAPLFMMPAMPLSNTQEKKKWNVYRMVDDIWIGPTGHQFAQWHTGFHTQMQQNCLSMRLPLPMAQLSRTYLWKIENSFTCECRWNSVSSHCQENPNLRRPINTYDGLHTTNAFAWQFAVSTLFECLIVVWRIGRWTMEPFMENQNKNEKSSSNS